MRTTSIVASVIVALALAACASSESKLDSGLWHYSAGLYGEAAPRLIKSVPALASAKPNDPRVVTGYLALARMAANAGATANVVEGYYEKAQDAARRHHAGDATLTRNVATEVGNFYLGRDQHAEALPFLLEAARISENNKSTPRLIFAVDLDNVAVAQSALGNFALAAQYSDNALKELASVPDGKQARATHGIILFNRAVAYQRQGIAAPADEAYRRSLELINANSEKWRRRVVVTNYAQFLRAQRREMEAEELERRYPK